MNFELRTEGRIWIFLNIYMVQRYYFGGSTFGNRLVRICLNHKLYISYHLHLTYIIIIFIVKICHRFFYVCMYVYVCACKYRHGVIFTGVLVICMFMVCQHVIVVRFNERITVV